ncbi:hypothetical protein F4804DRAFT_310788 [Jackrogersella minutella]|nr:hypothetical protein F4804DRAFT_310788 [Jackrogersella minutella]
MNVAILHVPSCWFWTLSSPDVGLDRRSFCIDADVAISEFAGLGCMSAPDGSLALCDRYLIPYVSGLLLLYNVVRQLGST